MLWLPLLACSSPPDLRIGLDFPQSGKSAIVRVNAAELATVAAIDLLSGEGADALGRAKLGEGTVELSAFVYTVPLVDLGLSAGVLSPVEGGTPLPTTSLRFVRESSGQSPGQWTAHPDKDMALDSFHTQVNHDCTPLSDTRLELALISPKATLRGLFSLPDGRLGAATEDGQLHLFDPAQETPVLERILTRAATSLHCATVSPDGRLWVAVNLNQEWNGPYDLLVGTAANIFSAKARRTAETEAGRPLITMRFKPGDGSALFAMTDTGAVVRYDVGADQWSLVMSPLRATPIRCASMGLGGEYDLRVPNDYCGGLFWEGDLLLAFDPAGTGALRTELMGSVRTEMLLPNAVSALVTSVAETELGLTAIRGDLLNSDLQLRRQGRWEALVTALPTLRMYAMASLSSNHLLLFGTSGNSVELVEGQPCKNPLTISSTLAIGAAARAGDSILVGPGDHDPLARINLHLLRAP